MTLDEVMTALEEVKKCRDDLFAVIILKPYIEHTEAIPVPLDPNDPRYYDTIGYDYKQVVDQEGEYKPDEAKNSRGKKRLQEILKTSPVFLARFEAEVCLTGFNPPQDKYLELYKQRAAEKCNHLDRLDLYYFCNKTRSPKAVEIFGRYLNHPKTYAKGKFFEDSWVKSKLKEWYLDSSLPYDFRYAAGNMLGYGKVRMFIGRCLSEICSLAK